MRIKFKAIDTLFFRDGKPFTMGTESAGANSFPPSPGVFYGAIRSAYASHLGLAAQEIAKHTLDLVIHEIQFYHSAENQYYLPTPLDIVLNEESEALAVLQPVPFQELNAFSNYPYPYLLKADFRVGTLERSLISEDLMKFYLEDEDPPNKLLALNTECIQEEKTGIARDPLTRVTREGFLYRINMLRLPNLQFVLGINYPFSKLSLMIKLGGEGRACTLSSDPFERPPLLTLKTKYFKILLTTPAFFKSGYEPDLKSKLGKGLEVEIMSAVVGKKVAIGGFDMVKKQPKPMLYAVPAGSVYYCKLKEGNIADLMVKLNALISISDDRENEGFGLFRIGKWSLGCLEKI